MPSPKTATGFASRSHEENMRTRVRLTEGGPSTRSQTRPASNANAHHRTGERDHRQAGIVRAVAPVIEHRRAAASLFRTLAGRHDAVRV